MAAVAILEWREWSYKTVWMLRRQLAIKREDILAGFRWFTSKAYKEMRDKILFYGWYGTLPSSNYHAQNFKQYYCYLHALFLHYLEIKQILSLYH